MKKYFILLIIAACTFVTNAQQTKIIIDADTGNEVDDLFAISRAMLVPEWDVIALNATHYQPSHWAVEKSMEDSYRLNEVLLSYLGKSGKTKSLKGATNRLFDWGDMEQPSSAAYNIIVEAQKLNDNMKLKIVALGALTNVASAILMEPSIEEKIELYWLGTSYDFEEDVLKKIDFNCVMDIQAVEVLFNSEVEMHVIPVNVAVQMLFGFEELKNTLGGKHPLFDFLIHRWYNHFDGGRYERTIWDLAIVDALIFTEKVTEVKFKTSNKNGNRGVYYYKTIDSDFFRQDFYDTLLKFPSEVKY